MGLNDEGPAAMAGLEEGNRIASINGVDLRVAREDAGDAMIASAKVRRLQRELEKVKNQHRASTIMQRQTVAAKAGQLHHYRVMHGDIAEINNDLDGFMAVTREDILRVAREYITPGNRTTMVVRPAESST